MINLTLINTRQLAEFKVPIDYRFKHTNYFRANQTILNATLRTPPLVLHKALPIPPNLRLALLHGPQPRRPPPPPRVQLHNGHQRPIGLRKVHLLPRLLRDAQDAPGETPNQNRYRSRHAINPQEGSREYSSAKGVRPGYRYRRLR